MSYPMDHVLLHLQQSTPEPKGKQIVRTHRRTYQPTPARNGGRKVGRQHSKVIGNPYWKHSGAGIIWNQV